MARENLRIGVCEVFLNEVSLGETIEGVVVTLDREFQNLVVDRHGTTPMDKALIGQSLSAAVKLAEITKSNLERAIPEGRYAYAGSDGKVGIGTKAGYLIYNDAQLLRLHPVRNLPSNRNEDIYIFKAVSTDAVELVFKNDEQQGIPIKFEALVDETQADGETLGRVGDQDIS
jgi:hypothetical protein